MPDRHDGRAPRPPRGGRTTGAATRRPPRSPRSARCVSRRRSSGRIGRRRVQTPMPASPRYTSASVAMISRMSSAGSCSKKPERDQLRHPDGRARDAELGHQVAGQPRPGPALVQSRVRDVLEVRGPQRERQHELERQCDHVDPVHRAVAHRDRDLHERFAAHDDRERAQSLDEVFLVEGREFRQAARPRRSPAATRPRSRRRRPRRAAASGSGAATTKQRGRHRVQRREVARERGVRSRPAASARQYMTATVPTSAP